MTKRLTQYIKKTNRILSEFSDNAERRSIAAVGCASTRSYHLGHTPRVPSPVTFDDFIDSKIINLI